MNINTQIQIKSFLSPNLSKKRDIFSLLISNRHFENVTKITLLIIVHITKHNKKGNIFDAPTIAGLGEAGREAIVPLEGRYMRPFASTIAEEMDGMGTTNNFYITVDGAENPEAFADRLVSQLKFRTRMA